MTTTTTATEQTIVLSGTFDSNSGGYLETADKTVSLNFPLYMQPVARRVIEACGGRIEYGHSYHPGTRRGEIVPHSYPVEHRRAVTISPAGLARLVAAEAFINGGTPRLAADGTYRDYVAALAALIGCLPEALDPEL